MCANRVGGPPPSDPGKQDTKGLGDQARPKRLEKVEGVEKVDEDARSKGRRFQEALDRAEEDFQNAKRPRLNAPSPFETSFYTKEPLDRAEPTQIPTPRSSPPPNVSSQRPAPPEPQQRDLPRSDDFWNRVDEPPDVPPEQQSMQEEEPGGAQKTASQKKKKKEEGPPITPHLKEEKPPFGRKKSSEKGEGQKGIGKEEELASTNVAVPPPLPHTAKETKKEKKEAYLPASPFSKEQQIAGAQAEASRERQQQEQGKKEKEKHPIEIESPSVPPLPSEVVPMAQAAATQAAPYLSPQVLSLFYQIVGTIYVMAAKPGISQTEIHLNAPSFANSRFFGATILIEKYASAPDALNIRLSGSNEAVTAFNQNISSLMAAFQNGNFSFRINRIDTVYSSERPLFRRKEPGRGRGGGGGLNG